MTDNSFIYRFYRVRPPICVPEPICVLYMHVNREHTIRFRHTNRGSYPIKYNFINKSETAEKNQISYGKNFTLHTIFILHMPLLDAELLFTA